MNIVRNLSNPRMEIVVSVVILQQIILLKHRYNVLNAFN